jgi:outer membrane usher protein FimD/PapC
VGTSVAVAADEEGMFLDIKVNQVQRGEFATYRAADGDIYVRLSDFPQLGLKRDISLPRVRIEGESGSFVSLRELGATRMDLDTGKMALELELPPEVFDRTALDFGNQATRDSLTAAQTSGFLNYRLADTAYGSADPARTLATEIGLRYGRLLFLNQSQFRENGDTSRYLTQLVHDRPEDQQRLIAGDFFGTSGELGSALNMGGLNFSKVYSMTPELIPQPLAGFAGVANSPSQVEVRMGGVPVAYSQVGAGPFQLQNLRQYGGAGDVQVIVRDALGREQLYTFPFYFSEQSLREGLQEYSYSLGKIRTNPGLPSEDYGKTAFSAFHRFGYSDALTLGVRAEAAENLSNAGLSAIWRSDQWGVLSGAVSGSDYAGQVGDAEMLAYNYQQSNFGLGAVARNYSPHYAPLETLISPFNRSGEYGVNMSWRLGPNQSLSLGQTLSQTRDQGDTRISSLNYFQNLGRNSVLYATLQRTDDDQTSQPNTSLFIGWLYRFDNKYTASASASQDERGHQTLMTQVGRDIPTGEGLGYRVGWTGTQPDNADRFNGYAQWNLPAASLSVDANTYPAQGGSADYRELAIGGSVAFAGSAWGLSRQINDSFAIVQMGAPVSGVPVMVNSQQMGVSNASGQVINPSVGSFYESRISVDDKNVPLNYVMGRDFFTVKPAYRSGVGVNFGLRRMRGLDGVIRMREGNDTPTADNRLVTLTREGVLEQEIQVGRGGHFYIENIAPGEYHGEIRTTNQSCRFVMQVPDTGEVVFTLPGDLICE